MATREVGPWPRILACEARGGAGIYDLCAVRTESRADLLEGPDQRVVVALRRERSRRDGRLAALYWVAFRLPARQTTGKGSRPARARTRGTSTTRAPRYRDPRCHRRRRASHRRRPAPRRSPRKAPATATCVAATNQGRRCRRCRRRRRPECAPPGTRQPGRVPAAAGARSRQARTPRCPVHPLRRASSMSRPAASRLRS